MFDPDEYMAISGTGNFPTSELTLRVVNKLSRGNIPFLHLDMDRFPDGEQDFTIPAYNEIKNKHILIFQGMHKEGEDLGSQLLTLIWATKNQYHAKSVTAVVFFLLYRRQEQADKPWEINRNLMFLEQMKYSGLDRVVFCDLHSPETLVNCEKIGLPAWDTDPTPVFSSHLRPLVDMAHRKGNEYYIYSPDEGSVPRAVALAKELKVKIAMNLKNRAHSGEVGLIEENIAEKAKELSEQYDIEIVPANDQLKGKCVCIREDEITTGNTAKKAGVLLKEQIGVSELSICVTHPVLTDGWRRIFLHESPYDHVFVGNTILRGYNKKTGGKFTTVDMSQVIGNKLYEILNDSD